MSWVRLDDAFFRHPKALAAGPLGRALYLASLCHCAHGLTDGFVSSSAIPMLLIESGAKKNDVTRVINAGLWRDVPGGFEVHDYLHRNPDAETVRSRRDARARAGAIGGKKSRPPSKPEANASAFASDPGANGSKQNGTPSPYPSVDSSSVGSRPHPQAVDDDEASQQPDPLDPVEILVRAVFERCADAKTAGIVPTSPGPYRTRVLENLETEHGEQLRAVIASHPDAPVQTLAGWVLGEPNSLGAYRKADA